MPLFAFFANQSKRIINCETMGLGSSLVSSTNNADNHNRKTMKDRAFGFFGGGNNRPGNCRGRNSFGGRRCRCRNIGLDP